MAKTFVPADYQLPLPVDELISRSKPGEEAVPMDVLFVGGNEGLRHHTPNFSGSHSRPSSLGGAM